MTPDISFTEVKKHKSKKSLWIVIHNDVYDVTPFLEEHPGGEDTLLEVGGKDGTQQFEDVGHSEDARELLKKFKIGTIPANERKKDVPQNCCKKCTPPKSSPPKSQSKTWRTFDGTSCSQKKPAKSAYKSPVPPKAERRVEAVIVPPESNTLKWALLALAGAIIIGIVLKKTMG